MDVFANLESASHVRNVVRHRGRNLFGARVYLTEEEGDGYWSFTRVRDDMFVIVGDFAYKAPRVERLAGDGLIQFCFNLAGDLTLEFSRSRSLRLAQPSLLIYQHPPDVELTEWTQPRARERIVAINVRPRMLLELVADDASALPAPLQLLADARAGCDLPYVQLPLTAAMFDIASRLMDNPFEGPLALAYTEALGAELLCVAAGNMGRLCAEPSEQYTEREVRCLRAARAILMNQLARPPTIRQVARAAGLSETTLKCGFKALFGETVADFSVRCRMQHALRLFREQRLSVAEVGEAVGYRHQTSFATAFRRHFGLRPKDVRRTRQV